MSGKREPKLRTAEKVPPPYPLGKFQKDFIFSVGRQIVYLLSTKPSPSLEGAEWELIFANAIKATWKPSNIGLDDIILGNCAWGAKTIIASKPWSVNPVRLISGRNSTYFSYGSSIRVGLPPNPIGEEVLNIWNTRVESIRKKYAHVRTIVLIKSRDLLNLTIFEIETVRYDPSLYEWVWNKRGNLEGFREEVHFFTWQPHGSQFTIIENVPDNKICFKLKSPGRISEEYILEHFGFDESWIEVVKIDDEGKKL